MRRLLLGPLAVLMLVLGLALAPHATRAADLPYAGTWKIIVLDQVTQMGMNEIDVWLVKMDKEGKKIELVSALPNFAKSQFADYKPDAKALRVVLRTMSNLGNLNLNAYPVKGKADQMTGSLRVYPANFLRIRLEKTDAKAIEPKSAQRTVAGSADLMAALKTTDPEERIKAMQDVLKDHEGKPITYRASQFLLGMLAQQKKPVDEFKAPIKAHLEQAAQFGHETTVGAHLVVAQGLLNYDKTHALALEHARKAADLAKDTDPKGMTISSYMVLVVALEKNKKTDEIKPVIEKIGKAAESAVAQAKEPAAKFGTTEAIARLLLGSTNPAVADIGLEQARNLVKLVKEDMPVAQRLGANKLLAVALTSRGKADEAKKLAPRIEQLEQDYDKVWAKDNMRFIPDKFSGRKGKSDRVVLVELFTGAQCPPCVSADIAFDAALKTYPAKDVAFLQYHLHIPGPDALTNADSEARSKFYGDDVEGTPTMFVNGKVSTPMGGFKEHAKDRYEKLRELIDKDLEDASEATIKLKATRQGNKIDVTADVSGVKKPGAKVKLRLVLVEDVARYVGNNGQRLHHHVVRDFLGNVDGFKLEKASASEKASVDLGELRQKLNKYLTASKRPFLTPDRPMALKALKVVAFIQDDDSKKVYQATQVDVPQ
jgi:hypothetical protein